LQTKDYFKKPPIIRYDIFRHNLKNLHRDYSNKSLDELVSDLTNSIKYSLSLPFSLVFELYSKENKFCARYDGEGYNKCGRINSSGLHTLLAYPEEVIKELGLDMDRFRITKKKFPENVEINGLKVNSFPVLFVFDKKYNEFIDTLQENIDSNPELSRRIYMNTKGLVGEIPKEEILENDPNLESVFGPMPKETCPF
jgi:hypothetical protein